MLSTKSFILSSILILTGGFGSVAGATNSSSVSDQVIHVNGQNAPSQQTLKDTTKSNWCSAIRGC